MKKRNIVLTVAALTVAAGAGAIAYNVVTTQKQMKGYDKQVSFKGEAVKFEDTFDSASYAVSYSGLHMDFTKAILKNNMGQLALFGNFSGIDIVVPKGWRVIANGVNHNSGINNACANLLSDDQPVLFITYNMKLSGLNIRAENAEKAKIEEKAV